ncbi:peptidase G2 autoproteolytic cleavage domain-containing protein, partial [uncultured Helicobacter sp.]|uniref:peptidase G2 autoproteolytic cleavage domain-containing protein n=1 Tax=uncultured Helicobacter sp. TaxID=175537 RepID=UPI00260DAA5A
NGLRVTSTEVLGLTYKSSGADYAENFEWKDGNIQHEDRCGRFVTLDEDKIRLAQPDDEFILGIISGDPSVVGDTYDDQWKGMNERDVFGRYIWEDVEVPDEYEEVDDPPL